MFPTHNKDLFPSFILVNGVLEKGFLAGASPDWNFDKQWEFFFNMVNIIVVSRPKPKPGLGIIYPEPELPTEFWVLTALASSQKSINPPCA